MLTLKTLIHFLMMISMAMASSVSAAVELPRMWVAVKPGGGPTIYLLGITHLGVDAEYDTYLDRRILPAARRASRFYLEGVAPARQVGSEPACDEPLTDPEAVALESKARAQLEELEFDNFRSLRDHGTAFTKAPDVQLRAMARSDAHDLSELGLMGAFGIYGKSQQLPGPVARGSVVDTLLKTFKSYQVHDIDEEGAFAKAYCGMGPSRIRYFYSQTLGRDLAEVPDSARQLVDMMDTVNRDFIDTIKQHKASGSLVSPMEWDVSMTCARNAQWIRKLDSQAPGSTLFVAVGVVHIFPIVNSPVPCHGILKNLGDQGYSVRLVE